MCARLAGGQNGIVTHGQLREAGLTPGEIRQLIRAFEWDRRKTMALEDAGYHVIRVTRRQLEEEPYLVIAHIARALDRHPPAAGLHANVAVAAAGSV